MHWLTEVPVAVVAASLRMLPRLQAEETIRTAHAVAAGRGIDPGKAGYERWGSIARGEEPRRARAATIADLRAAGIAVRKAPARRKDG